MDSKSYAKGGDVRSIDYAAGGPVLGRTKDFMKTPDEFREKDNDGKTDEVWGKGSGEALSKRTGDKSLPTIKPKK